MTIPPPPHPDEDDIKGFGLTRKYTLESWRSGEVLVRPIPESIYRMTVEEMVHKLFSDYLVNLNPIEQILYLTFGSEGWRVTRLPMNRSNPVDRIRKSTFRRLVAADPDLFHGAGVPDFLLWRSDTEEYRFVEVKHSEKGLSPRQVEWMERFDQDLFIARLAPVASSDQEIIEFNRSRRVPIEGSRPLEPRQRRGGSRI